VSSTRPARSHGEGVIRAGTEKSAGRGRRFFSFMAEVLVEHVVTVIVKLLIRVSLAPVTTIGMVVIAPL
jgi:hypothetical protein